MSDQRTPGPWFVVVDNSQQDEFGNGPTGVAISIYEDDATDAIAWMQEGTECDAELLASAPELAASLRELLDLAVIDQRFWCESQSKKAIDKAELLLRRIGF